MALATLAAPARAQGVAWQRPALSAELSAAGSGPFLTDGNDLAVRAGVGPALAVAASWPAGHRYDVGAFVRGSRATVDLSQGGSHWSAGHVSQLDLGATAARRVRDRFAIQAGAAASWISGPADIAPFRFVSSGTPHLSGELGASARVVSSLPIYGVVRVQATSFGGVSSGDPAGGRGTVTRLLGGLRYGS